MRKRKFWGWGYADEILSDYSHNGVSYGGVSHFGGKFPENLNKNLFAIYYIIKSSMSYIHLIFINQNSGVT